MMLERVRRRSRKAGPAVGSVASAVIGGVPGAAAGVAIDLIADEVLSRYLSSSERRRIEGTRVHAAQRLRDEIDKGRQLRRDDFFTAPSEIGASLEAPWGTERPAGLELLEAILMLAGRTYEELKLPHISELLVSLVLDEDVTAGYAHYLTRAANALSYRQLQLVAIFHGDLLQPGLRLGGVQPNSRTGVGMDLEDLARRGLVGTNEPGGDAYPTNSILEVGVQFIKTTRDGRRLFELMRLDRAPASNVDRLVAELSEEVEP